jgi:hypothetical protein
MNNKKYIYQINILIMILNKLYSSSLSKIDKSTMTLFFQNILYFAIDILACMFTPNIV